MLEASEAEDALWAVHSRLGAIEGKVNLIARADRKHLLGLLEEAVRKDNLIGQLYLVLDGERTQHQVHELLHKWGIEVSQPTVSRRISKMETEHGIAVLIKTGNTKVHRRDTEMEKILNLSKKIREWLTDEGAVVPVKPARRSKRGKENE